MSKEIKKQEMKCSEIKDKLIAYMQNDLPEAEMKAFEEHLSQCSDCMYIYNMVQDQWQVIEEEKQLEPDPFYLTRIEQAIDNINKKSSDHSYTLVFRTVRSVAAVLILLISIATGIFIGSQFNDKATATYESEYEYYSDLMYLNSYEDEPIENFLLNREEE